MPVRVKTSSVHFSDLEDTRRRYEKQLNENPSDLDALYNYGRFLWKVRKDLAAAEGAFVRVLENDPLDEVLSLLLPV